MKLNYISIPVATLRGGQRLTFNVYLRTNDSMIIYAERGDSFQGARLNRLKDKRLKRVYILQEDAERYNLYVSQNYNMAYDDHSSLNIEERAAIIHGDQQANADALMANPDDKKLYLDSKNSASQFVNFILRNSDSISSLLSQYSPEPDMAVHAVNVATLTVELARKFGHQDSKLLPVVALGALLHDVGHYREDFVYPGDVSKLNSAEQLLYYEHPARGAAFVQHKSHFDSIVLHIILQHEECLDGSGFPKGLHEKQMDPMSILVGAANSLDRTVTLKKMPIEKAAKFFMVDGIGKYPLNYLKHLSEILPKVYKPQQD